MIFQTLDDKNECVGYYYDNNLFFNNNIPDNLNKTWSYSSFLKNKNLEYAQLYCDGKTIDEACPEHLKEEWKTVNNKIKSVVSSCIESKVSLRENCFFDLTPKKFLLDYCSTKNKICEFIFTNYNRPIEYNFYKRFSELLTDIKHRDLNVDIKDMENKLYKENAINFYKKVANGKQYINYNLFGSITGRLTVKKNSFPILTFPKQYRNILKPNNDWFVSFDMNAAELRTALALMGAAQPVGDFHQWSVENIYSNQLSRAEAKETTTSWLYNSNSANAIKYNDNLSKVFDKDKLKNKYFLDHRVKTPYNREIKSDDYHAISYLNQSTFIDLFHRQIIKVYDYLQNKKSFVAFMIHDEFVLDMTDDEKNNIIDIINILQDTPYGTFPVNIKAGKDFSNMKKLNLKV